MLKSVIVTGLLFLNLSLRAEVSSDFLVSLASKFKSKLGDTVYSKDFLSELNDEESRFLEETHNYDYKDIFEGTLPNVDDVYSYNLFHMRGLTSWFKDMQLNTETVCSLVSTDGTHFKKHKFKVFRNSSSSLRSKEWRFSYCAGSDENSDMDSVIYYFHGAAGNPYNFVQRDATYAVRERWRENGGRLPRWISVSIGSIGHMGEVGMEEKFFKVIAPYIERELGFTKRPNLRFGFGISQGGANVLHTILRGKGFLDAAVAICPAASAMEPFASKDRMKAYRVRTAASILLLRLAIHFLPVEFFDKDYFFTNVDSLRLGQKLLNKDSAPLYIQTSSHDELGLQEGGQLFAMLARTQGAPVIFEELKGGHCVLRPRKVADFFKDFQNGETPLQLKMLGRTRR